MRVSSMRLSAAKARDGGRSPSGPTRLRAIGTVELKAAPAEGKRPTLSINAYNGTLFRPWTNFYLDRPVIVDLAGLKAAEPIAILMDHYASQIVGQSTEVKIGTNRVDVEGVITGNIEAENDPAHKVVFHARNGFVWKASIGMNIERLEKIEGGQSVTVNGQKLNGPIYVARAGLMDEVSLLSVAADSSTSASIAARNRGGSNMDFEQWLKARGIDPTKLTDPEHDILLKAYQAEQPAPPDPAPGADPTNAPPATPAAGSNGDDPLAAIKARNARHDRIRRIAAETAEKRPNAVDQIEAQMRVALAENHTPERFELALYRDVIMAPGNASNLLRDRGLPNDPRLFEAGMCMACKLPELEKHFDAKILEAATRRWRHGLSIGELLLTAAKANGFSGLSHRDVAPLLRAAFAPMDPRLHGGPPTMIDVAGILSNIANKFLVVYFMSVDQAWSAIARRRSVNDFKSITSYSLVGANQYEELGPGGELKHGTLSELGYSNKADTRGLMLALDRRDIINDDLGAFTQVMNMLGRGGALKLNDVFWKKFMNNGSFFTAGRNNFLDGADTALSVESLEVAESLFATQTGPDKKPLGISPAILLMPSKLKRTGLRILNSSELRRETPTTGAAATYGTRNTFEGDFTPVSTPYLQNSAFTGFSAKKWYLLANPNDMPVIEACFLNGVERPTVEQAQANFDTLGIQVRGYFDFGVELQEYRGGVAMKGE